MPIQCEEKWPILLVTWDGEASDEEFDRYIAWLQRTNRIPRKRVSVMNLMSGLKLPTSQMNKQTQQIKGDKEHIDATSLGIAFVVKSMVVRTLLKSVLFVSPLTVPQIVVPTLEEAMAWANDRLKAAHIAPV